MISTAWITHGNRQHTDDAGHCVHTKPLICQFMLNILNFHLKKKQFAALDPGEGDGGEEDEYRTPSSAPGLCPYCRPVLSLSRLSCIQESLDNRH